MRLPATRSSITALSAALEDAGFFGALFDLLLLAFATLPPASIHRGLPERVGEPLAVLFALETVQAGLNRLSRCRAQDTLGFVRKRCVVELAAGVTVRRSHALAHRLAIRDHLDLRRERRRKKFEE